MQENKKVYCAYLASRIVLTLITNLCPQTAFTITMYEYEATIPTLWGHVMDFAKSHPQYIAKDNALGFMSGDNGRSYNLCHCKLCYTFFLISFLSISPHRMRVTGNIWRKCTIKRKKILM